MINGIQIRQVDNQVTRLEGDALTELEVGLEDTAQCLPTFGEECKVCHGAIERVH